MIVYVSPDLWIASSAGKTLSCSHCEKLLESLLEKLLLASSLLEEENAKGEIQRKEQVICPDGRNQNDTLDTCLLGGRQQVQGALQHRRLLSYGQAWGWALA